MVELTTRVSKSHICMHVRSEHVYKNNAQARLQSDDNQVEVSTHRSRGTECQGSKSGHLRAES